MLNTIRRRTAHCRRPHEDDLSKVEQTLRDLRAGAHRVLSAFATHRRVWDSDVDPVTAHWVGLGDPESRNAVHTALDNGLEFQLRWSQRPWANIQTAGALSGQSGVLWHAEWRRPVGVIDIDRVLGSAVLDNDALGPSLIAVIRPGEGRLAVVLPAVDDSARTIDAIASWFAAVLSASSPRSARATADRREQIGPRIHDRDAIALAHEGLSWPLFAAD